MPTHGLRTLSEAQKTNDRKKESLRDKVGGGKSIEPGMPGEKASNCNYGAESAKKNVKSQRNGEWKARKVRQRGSLVVISHTF